MTGQIPWSIARATDQSGRVAVVTGANTGIGLEIARTLAARHATVVLACRNTDSARRAALDITDSIPSADVRTIPLDLADLNSIAAAAASLRDTFPAIDLLINNAGIMASEPSRTVDGFESDFGTNFLGHFALTGHVIDIVNAAPAARIVTVSSITHRRRTATLDFDDLHCHSGFDTALAYSRSKMAAMVFMIEMQRRLSEAGHSTISLAAHPGGVRTNILHHQNRLVQLVYNPRLARLTSWFTQSPADGALPVLRAALASDAHGGDFYGPSGRGELVGPPVPVAISRRAQDPDTGRRLWKAAEEMTRVRFLGTGHPTESPVPHNRGEQP